MTKDEIIAIKVMGWHDGLRYNTNVTSQHAWFDDHDRFVILNKDYYPSANREQALNALEKYMKDKGDYRFEISFYNNARGQLRCMVHYPTRQEYVKSGSVADAICQALIEAIGQGGGRETTNLDEIMRSQYPTINGWICPKCRNHKGDLNCIKGVLICWVGANMKGCVYFIEERREEGKCGNEKG
jgi:hypothetical protein